MMPTKITNEAKAIILANLHLSYQQLANMIGDISPRTIEHWCVRNKVDKPRAEKPHNEELYQWMRANYHLYSNVEIADMHNTTSAAINTLAKRLKLRKPEGFRAMKRRLPQTEIDRVVELYETHTSKEIAEMLNLDIACVKSRLNKYFKGKKPNIGCWAKGNEAWNKGKKGVNGNNSATRFKKGNQPHNTHPIGTIVSKWNKGYLYIKTDHYKWEPYATYIWRQANGEIPANHQIHFKDGNTLNCTLENLELVEMSQYVLFHENTIKKQLMRDPEKRKFIPEELIEMKRINLRIDKLVKK